MKAVDIVNRLKQILPKYTDDFSTIISVDSLTRSDTTITCVTSTAHGLTSGDYITIRGAKRPIALSGITFANGIATATSIASHELSDPSLYSPANLPLYVEIAGATGFNGSWELVSVSSDFVFTFKVTGSPSDISGGYLLLEDQDAYNGYKQITTIDATTFTYSTTGSMQSPAQGTIEVSGLTRIDYSATAQRIQDYYSQNQNDLLQPWLFVVMNQAQAYKRDNVIGDASSSKKRNESYWSEYQQSFSIYAILPAKNSIMGGDIADTARDYLKPILKSISNYIFSSDLVEEYLQPCQYVGNEADDYIEATYTHRFDFTAQGIIQNEDTVDFNNGVPLKRIEGTISDQDLDYYLNAR